MTDRRVDGWDETSTSTSGINVDALVERGLESSRRVKWTMSAVQTTFMCTCGRHDAGCDQPWPAGSKLWRWHPSATPSAPRYRRAGWRLLVDVDFEDSCLGLKIKLTMAHNLRRNQERRYLRNFHRSMSSSDSDSR